MKRNFKLFIPVLILSALLCGCSCDDGKIEEKPTKEPVMSPLPEMTPEIEYDDSSMNDKNRNYENGTVDNKGSASDKNNMLEEYVMLSPAPTISPEPANPEN